MRKFYAFIGFCIALTIIMLFASGCRDVEAEPTKNLEPATFPDASFDASEDSLPHVLADGVVIGKLIDYDINLKVQVHPSFEPVRVWADGTIEPTVETYVILFSETDCGGEAYSETSFNNDASTDASTDKFFRLQQPQGKLFACHAPECPFPLYYLKPYENEYYIVSIRSDYADGRCGNLTNPKPPASYYRLQANVPTTTGIDQYPFSIPVTFEGMEQLRMERIEALP